jgi:hypothetical protein
MQAQIYQAIENFMRPRARLTEQGFDTDGGLCNAMQ